MITISEKSTRRQLFKKVSKNEYTVNCDTGNKIVVRFASVQSIWFHALYVLFSKVSSMFSNFDCLTGRISYSKLSASSAPSP